MPRQPKKQTAVIPTTSLVASSVRYTGEMTRIYQPRQDWQTECYRHYAICGEARHAANFFGHSLSRAVLQVEKPTSKAKREGAKDDHLTASHGVVTSGAAANILAELFNGEQGQSQMLKAIGIHLTIAGDCYLVGRAVDGKDVWEVVSVMEMHVSGSKWTIKYGDGMNDVPLTENDVVIRIWNPNPGRRIEADSPFRSLLPILSEIEWLTRHIFAQTSSRLAGAGLLFMPQGMSFPPPPDQEGEAAPANDADAFMLTLAEAMLTPIEDPSSPAAMVPIVVTAPDDVIDKAKLMHFWSQLDQHAMELRQEAIRRFALGMDLPPEQVLGMSSNSGTGGGASNGISHWGAWQIEESTIKMFIEPMLELICNALTISYLRPLLPDGAKEFIGYDTHSLRLRPDRSKEAFELYDRAAIGIQALLRETGFDHESDAMGPDEFKTWLLRKVASGSATPEMVAAALERLEVDLGMPDIPQGPMREARPDPSLIDHPLPKAPPEAAALLAASDALVFRALERAGNRIRQKEGVKPPGVPSYKVHTLFAVNGSADEVLDDAWSCAPQVLDGLADVDKTVATLNAYCRALFAEQQPHTRERLRTWLEATS